MTDALTVVVLRPIVTSEFHELATSDLIVFAGVYCLLARLIVVQFNLVNRLFWMLS